MELVNLKKNNMDKLDEIIFILKDIQRLLWEEIKYPKEKTNSYYTGDILTDNANTLQPLSTNIVKKSPLK